MPLPALPQNKPAWAWVTVNLSLWQRRARCLVKNVKRTLPGWLIRLLLPVLGPARHFAWRLKPAPAMPPDAPTPDMLPTALEGYTTQPFYRPGQTVAFHLKALLPTNTLRLEYYQTTATWQTVTEHFFDELPQPETLEEARNGCHWTIGWEYFLPPTAPAGYYRVLLVNPRLEQPSQIHFLVGPAVAQSNVLVLAPVTTWTAYNAYGGQSLYRNALGEGYAPLLSTQRPNTALTYQYTHPLQHSLAVEAHIYQWFAQHYQADVLPDYYLEAQPHLFQQYQLIVLAYHAEYFSARMYATLWNLILKKGISLLALGGNQVYWQVRWHQNFTQLECRKSGSFFQNEPKRGSLWRHTSRPEARLLGAQFTEPGTDTYAPYQVVQPRHWLFEGTGVQEGQHFGESGMDGLPICGDETDKTAWSTPASTVVLAKGLNKATATTKEIYTPDDPAWNGAGGGEMTFTQVSENCGVLNTGAIQSGAGLGADAVFTAIIQNFMHRFAHTSSGGTNAAETATAPASA